MKKTTLALFFALIFILSGVLVLAEVPSIVLNGPDSGIYLANGTNIIFNFTATDDLNDSMICILYVKGELGQIYTWNDQEPGNNTPYPITVNSSIFQDDDFYNWSINCSDGESNGTSEIRNFIKDSIASNYSYNSTNATYAGQAIKHNLMWRDVSLSGYIFSLDNGNASFINDSWHSFSGTTNWSNVTKTVNSTVGSTIMWRVYVNDSAGNWNVSDEFSYTTIDGTAPVEAFGTNPVDKYNDSDGSIVFGFKCSDNVGVSYIQLWTNTTGVWHANYTNSSYTNNTWLNITVAGIAQARNYKWAVWCNDSSENANMTTNRTFNVDKTDPEITSTDPDDEEEYTLSSGGTKTVTFTYQVIDNFGIKNCSLYIDGSVEDYDSSVLNDIDQTFSYTFVDDGDYDWEIECFDYAGRSDESLLKTMTINPYSSSSSDTTTCTSGAKRCLGNNLQRCSSNTWATIEACANGCNSTSLTCKGVTTNTTTTPNLISTLTQTYDNLTQLNNKTYDLSIGGLVNFTLNNATHALTVQNLTDDSATIEVKSDPVVFTLKVNKTKEVDLDGNKKNDFSVTLLSLADNKASLMIKALSESSFSTNPNGEIRIDPGAWKWIALVLTIIVIAFVIATIIFIKRKKKNWWKKGK